MTRRLELYLLDGFRLRIDDHPQHVSATGQRLLGLLAVRRQMTRTELAGTLWSATSEKRASGSLRTTLWRLRQQNSRWIEAWGDTLVLSHAVDVDVHQLAEAASRVINSSATSVDPGDIARVLAPSGELLPGWYDDWALFERERLHQLRVHALESAAGHLCASGHYAAAVDAALEAIQLEPLRETAHRALITTYLFEGNVGAALRQFDRFRNQLVHELGIEPSAQLKELIAARLSTPRAGEPDVRSWSAGTHE
jgi:DNA-binding SARP family transcriptional activator